MKPGESEPPPRPEPRGCFLGGLEAPDRRDAEVLVAGVVSDIPLHRTAAISGHADDDSLTALSGARAQKGVLEEPPISHKVEAGHSPRHFKHSRQALARSYERFLRPQPLLHGACECVLAKRIWPRDRIRRFSKRIRIERPLEATAKETVDQKVELFERQDEILWRRWHEDAGTGADCRQLRLAWQIRLPRFEFRKRIEEARGAHEHMGRQEVGAELNAQFIGGTGGNSHVVSPKTKRTIWTHSHSTKHCQDV